MLPLATVPAAAGPVTTSCCPEGGGGAPGREGGPRRARPPRDAARAWPRCWRCRDRRDAAGRLTELPGPGSGIVACGALPGAVAPVPAWTAGELAAAGVAAEPGRVRDGTGLGLVSCVIGPAVLDEALAGVPARRARKITPRLAMQLPLARALDRGPHLRCCGSWRSGPGRLTRAMTCRPPPRCRTPTASCRSSRSRGCSPRCAGRSGRCRCPAWHRTCPRPGRRTGTGRRSGCAR